jgi:hypothetical protein
VVPELLVLVLVAMRVKLLAILLAILFVSLFAILVVNPLANPFVSPHVNLFGRQLVIQIPQIPQIPHRFPTHQHEKTGCVERADIRMACLEGMGCIDGTWEQLQVGT